MQTNIREMKAEDIDKVMDIWLSENITSHFFLSENFWQKEFEKAKERILKSKVFISEEENNIQGFISLSGNYIEYLFVKSNYQRNGIGRKLLKHCKNIFWSLMLKVYEENSYAVNFFDKQTFYVRDKMDNAETGKSEIFMEWIR